MLSRSDWGARDARGSQRLHASEVRGVAIHYNGPAINVKDPAATLRGIQRFHMNTRGWSDIAYNVAVFPDGSIWECRGLRRRSAANGTARANRRYVAIYCVIGQGQSVTQEMVEGIRQAVALTRDVYPGKNAVLPHVVVRGGGTACPGQQLIDLCNSGGLEPGSNGEVSATYQGRIYYRTENGDGLLTLGETGEDVEEVQRRLGLKVDGYYGPGTEKAVKGFQKAHGLDADGIVGPRTRAAMFPAPAPAMKPVAVVKPIDAPKRETGWFKTNHPLVRRGDNSDTVKHVQAMLALPEDGIFGPNTERAVRRFQTARGLAADGIVGRETWSRMHPILGPGDEGFYVGEIQREVGVKVDNDFGPKTDDALRSYQTAHGLAADGLAGPQTYRTML